MHVFVLCLLPFRLGLNNNAAIIREENERDRKGSLWNVKKCQPFY